MFMNFSLFCTQLGKLLLAEVNLGHVESVVRKDSSRTGPAKGYHAILVSPIHLGKKSVHDSRISLY